MTIDDHLRGGEARLWDLIEERTRASGDEVARIDRRIWDLFGADWGVMFTDLSGFSRQVARFGPIHFLQEILLQKKLLLPIIARHDGIVVGIEGDSFLILFKRPESALRCAIAMQHACQRFNEGRAPEDQVLLCVGIGYGRIICVGDALVAGAEVNASSKLGEDTAKSNEILVTHGLRTAVGDGVDGVRFEEIDFRAPGSDRNWKVAYPAAEVG